MKKGTLITWTRRNGTPAIGKVTGMQEGGRGTYLIVDEHDLKGKSLGAPDRKIRPTQAVVAGK